MPLKFLISACYEIFHSYSAAIAVFTLLTKIILFPVSVWTHLNSLKMVSLMPELNRLKITYYGDGETIAEETQRLYKQVRYNPFLNAVPMIVQLVLLAGVIGAVRNLLGGSESVLVSLPISLGGAFLLVPVAAGMAALLLGLSQNHINPLQREQKRGEQAATNGISVSISLLLGFSVPVGVGIYWICSNLFSILNQIVLNAVIPARKHVDYTALQESRKQLAELESFSQAASKDEKKREKADYRSFFSVANKHLVFYSENSGFYKYFRATIEYLLVHSNVIIHYVTNDPDDQIFEIAKRQERIHPYYIGRKKLITLMMKMDADVVVMTTPDLDNYYLKRSYVRKDIEYIYTDHGISSTTMVVRKGAYDNFDTIFCKGQFQIDEIRETEKLYHLPEKKLVKVGFGMLDDLIEQYQQQGGIANNPPKILIAPSWQKDNILDSCIHEMLPSLLERDYCVTVRPHPEYIKRCPNKVESLINRYKGTKNLVIETDFSSNATIFTADLVITDWSSIAFEFALCTLRPALFIDTPMKILNPDFGKYKVRPIDIVWRNEVGKSLKPEEAEKTGKLAGILLSQREEYKDKIRQLRQSNIFNIGSAGEAGGQYILSCIKKKQLERKEMQSS